jgi:uncharacterized protein YggU (UPF0235/DUF167 family)
LAIRIAVRVHPASRREEVRKLDDGSLEVWTRARPIGGQANVEVCRTVARVFEVPPSAVRVVGGLRGRLKLVEIE